MLSFIERMRQAPMRQRREMAVTLTFIIVGLIALIWVGSLLFKFTDSPESAKGQLNTDQNRLIQAPY